MINHRPSLLNLIPVCALIVSACSPGSTPTPFAALPETAPTEAAASTPTIHPKPPDLAPLTNALQASLQGTFIEAGADCEDTPGLYCVTWELRGELSKDLIILKAKEDTAAILQAVVESELPYQEVLVSGWYTQTVDINSNTAYAEFVHLYFARETLEQVRWENVRPYAIWYLYDHGRVHEIFKYE